MFKLGDTHLKKYGSVLLYLNISGLNTLILYLMGVLHLLEIQIQEKTFYCAFFTNIKAKE